MVNTGLYPNHFSTSLSVMVSKGAKKGRNCKVAITHFPRGLNTAKALRVKNARIEVGVLYAVTAGLGVLIPPARLGLLSHVESISTFPPQLRLKCCVIQVDPALLNTKSR